LKGLPQIANPARTACLTNCWLADAQSSIGFSRAVVRWRRIDLARVIEQRYGVKFAERSVGDLLRRLGFRRISVRPQCPEQDAAMQETHKKTLAIWSRVPSQRTDLRDLPEHNRKRNASMPLCAAA
jgi:hypothetical protein